MTSQSIYPIFKSRQKLKYILGFCLTLFIVANILLDYQFTRFQNSVFYFSESALFSTYWILFLPLLTIALKLLARTESNILRLFVMVSAIVLQLFVYPGLIWILSDLFYEHTFSYWQTFNYGLSAYLIKTVIIYGFCLAAFTVWNKKSESLAIVSVADQESPRTNFISSILITDSNNRKSVLDVNDIFYFSASSPYVEIYHLSRKHLYAETLRCLETQLNDQQFVRIHKSHIVNLDKVASIQSRQNGDYDLALSDGTILRVSRNYAKSFKQKFCERHQLTVK